MERLEALGRRWPWLGVALAVQRRFGEVHGGHLAAAVTMATFLSIFPLLLVGVAAVGWVAGGNQTLVDDVIAGLGLSGSAADAVRTAIDTANQSKRVASVLGVVGLLWSGLGLVATVSSAFDSVWQVQGRGIREKLIALAWLAGATLIFVFSLGLSAVLNFLPAYLAFVSIAVGLVVNTALWLWSFRALTNARVGWRAFLPGAVLGAVGLEILKYVGSIYVPRAVASASALWGSIGVIFALVAWLFFLGRLIVYAAVLNVVRWEDDHGTVSAEIRLPRQPDVVTLATNRSGDALEIVSSSS